jgi:outer membrane protein assembly factor BamA
VNNSTSKYTLYERQFIKSLVATLLLKRIPDAEIIKEIERQTNSTFTRFGLYNVKQQIKKESYDWYEYARRPV